MAELTNLIERMWTAVEAGRLDDVEALLDPDCHFKMPGVELRGAGGLRQLLAAYHTAFPDLRHRVVHQVEAGDTIALELEVTGTHTGPMTTPHGSVPATGTRVVWESCDYVRARNGRIVSWHVYHDPTAFYAALGIRP